MMQFIKRSVQTWLGYIRSLRKRRLTLSANKTPVYTFWSQKFSTVGVPMHVELGYALLEQVDSFKYLSLNLDARLNWKCHVKAVSSKVAQRIGV